MFPIRDDNPTLRTPVVTYGLIALNVAVWVLVQGLGTEPRLIQSVCELGMIPEYAGTLLTTLTPDKPATTDADDNATRLEAALKPMGLTALEKSTPAVAG